MAVEWVLMRADCLVEITAGYLATVMVALSAMNLDGLSASPRDVPMVDC